MNSFCAWYSFRMSFWSVPPSSRRGTPESSAAATYMASTIAAGPLIVIEVVTLPRSMPAYRSSHIRERVDRNPALPDLTEREGVVGVTAHERGEVVGGGEAVASRDEEVVEPPVRVGRGAEAGEHPHGPQLRPVHRGVRPACVRVQARELAVGGPVHGLDRDPRHRVEVRVAERRGVVGLFPLVPRCHAVHSLGASVCFDLSSMFDSLALCEPGYPARGRSLPRSYAPPSLRSSMLDARSPTSVIPRSRIRTTRSTTWWRSRTPSTRPSRSRARPAGSRHSRRAS